MTNDTDKAGAFYTKMFNWGTEVMDMGSGDYTMFTLGEQKVGGMMAITPEMGGIPPHWMYYITVDDVDASLQQASDLGGSVMIPATDIPVGRFAAVTDPSGAAISIITLKDNK